MLPGRADISIYANHETQTRERFEYNRGIFDINRERYCVSPFTTEFLATLWEKIDEHLSLDTHFTANIY